MRILSAFSILCTLVQSATYLSMIHALPDPSSSSPLSSSALQSRADISPTQPAFSSKDALVAAYCVSTIPHEPHQIRIFPYTDQCNSTGHQRYFFISFARKVKRFTSFDPWRACSSTQDLEAQVLTSPRYPPLCNGEIEMERYINAMTTGFYSFASQDSKGHVSLSSRRPSVVAQFTKSFAIDHLVTLDGLIPEDRDIAWNSIQRFKTMYQGPAEDLPPKILSEQDFLLAQVAMAHLPLGGLTMDLSTGMIPQRTGKRDYYDQDVAQVNRIRLFASELMGFDDGSRRRRVQLRKYEGEGGQGAYQWIAELILPEKFSIKREYVGGILTESMRSKAFVFVSVGKSGDLVLVVTSKDGNKVFSFEGSKD